MLHLAAQPGLTFAQAFPPESHREQMRKGLLSFHLHGFFYPCCQGKLYNVRPLDGPHPTDSTRYRASATRTPPHHLLKLTESLVGVGYHGFKGIAELVEVLRAGKLSPPWRKAASRVRPWSTLERSSALPAISLSFFHLRN